MADCGATGSALDQMISRALAMNDPVAGATATSSATKQLSTLVGRAAGAHHSQLHHQQYHHGPSIPQNIPEYMQLPPLPEHTYNSPPAAPAPGASMLSRNNHHHHPEAMMMMTHHHVHSHPHHTAPSYHHHAPHNHDPQSMTLLMQQQQQQQYTMHMHQVIAETQQRIQQQWHEQNTIEQQQPPVEQESSSIQEALQEHYLEEQLGHEGIVQHVSVEELMMAWSEAQEEYEDLIDGATNMGSTAVYNSQQYTTMHDKYEFQHTNEPEQKDAATNWLEEGMEQFRMGRINEAIRSFEMELQHNDQDNSLAWRMLGKCHAENDEDQKAIMCLEQAVERDPFAPQTHLALGVSYVNELDHTRALESLKAWIENNPSFAGIANKTHNDMYGSSGEQRSEQEEAFDEAQRLLLDALECSHGEERASVWEALGVMYNVSKDYDAAVDAFRKALESRPDDYQLLNKIGATLANNNQSSRALPEYEKALSLRPRYARAWLNKAISHANTRDYDEASRCYLETLVLNPNAVHCWSYLRVSLSCAERWDLIPLVASQDLDGLRKHFSFGKA